MRKYPVTIKAIAIRALKSWFPENTIGWPLIKPCNFPNAIKLPVKVSVPIKIERIIVVNPDKTNIKSHIEKCLSSTEGPIVSASDYIRLNSDQIRPFTRKSFYSFGTDGYGRSDTRKNLRKFFEVDKEHIVAYSLSVLAKEQLIPSKYASEAMQKYNIDPNKTIPTKL